MNADLFAPFSELASKLLPVLSGNDGAHDISHLSRVWRNVKDIQHQEGGDLEILIAAALLHDCVEVPKQSPLRSQASRLAASKATALLNDRGTGRALNDAAFALDHFPAKLLNLAEGFQTTSGRIIAAGRQAAIRSFYFGMVEELESEKENDGE